MDTDFPADTLPISVGLAVASVALLGVALGLPTAAPDATAPARTVDEVASSSFDASATTTFTTRSRLELQTHGLDRCREDACTHATFVFGPVTPVAGGSPLSGLLDGTSPSRRFDSSAAFRRAVADARRRDSPVVVADATELRARHVTWGGVDVTLVGA